MADLKDKVVLVTGASSGIGKEICLDLVKAGCKIIAAAHRVDRLNSLCSNINSFGSTGTQATALELDVASVQPPFEKRLRKLGKYLAYLQSDVGLIITLVHCETLFYLKKLARNLIGFVTSRFYYGHITIICFLKQLGKYQTAVATLRVRYLVAGAIITATMGVTLLLNLGTDFVTTNFNFIALLGAFYTVAVSVFIIMHRQSHPSPPPPPQPHQPPPPPPEFPNLKIFCKGVYPSLALAFFICIDDPLKSIETLSVPGICLCCYLHILVILAALRRRDDYRAVRLVAAAGSGSVNILRQLLFVSLTQDAASDAADADAETCGNQTNMAYGITDGCIAASYGLIFNSTSSFWIRFLTIIPVIILLGLRNLQFAIPVEEPHVLHQLNQALNQQLIQVNHQLNQALNQQVNHRRRVNQPQASKSSRNHRMI